MKKIITIALAAVLCLALFAGCSSTKEPETSPSAAASAVPTEEALSGTVSANGSTSMEKVIAALSEAFMAKYPDVTVTYDATGSGAGITAATDGTADIGLASRNLKAEETGLDATVIAIDGIAIVINKANTVTDLTLEQIAGLAKGEITNWKDVGGPDSPVVFVGREAGSGTRDGFESIVGVAEDCKYEQELTSTGAIIAAVASNENAFGYASLSAVKETVTKIKVAGVECTEATVLDGSYKLQRNFNIITKQGTQPSAAVKAFIEYAKSTDAASIIEKAGAIYPAK
ncbi:MAG: phosphate ABC transporter phosphate-binding protein [Firmicutes bacterium HGW-Firmicutes-16]|nr:MAG: phosphate ABC transporter phosphate-binding protein [Firmicutes bacterium HGW-Firmicutes-16]